MKTFKQIIASILSFVMILSMLPAVELPVFAATEYTYENFKYTVSNGEATITGCVDENIELISIPATVDSYKVVAIGSYAFNNMSQLSTVWFSNTIKTIEYGAFSNCDSLTSITIPDSVAAIKYANTSYGGAFSNCDNLQEVVIGNGLKSIETRTFSECPKLESVIIGNSVEYIGSSAFSGSALKTLIIPDSVTSIGTFAFSECKSLYAVKFGNNLQTIEYGAFSNCDSLTSITIPDSVAAIKYANTSYGGAFSNCDNLQEVVIGNGLKSIETRTFSECPKLQTVIIGTAAETIDNDAFANCSNLNTVLIFDNVTSIADNAFDSSERVEFYGYDGSYAQEYAIAHNIPFHIVSRELSIEEILASITSRKVDLELITGEYIGTYTGPQGLMGLEFDVYYADDLIENKTKLEEIAKKATIASIVYEDGKEIPRKVFTWRDIHSSVRNYSGKYIAIFYYFENAENEGVETGIYISAAKYDSDAQTYSFTGSEWLQHDTYSFADVNNAVIDGDYIVGEIWGTVSNGWFGTDYKKVGDLIVKKLEKDCSLPQDAQTFNGHTYKLIEQNVTWKQAEVICKQMGGHLITLNSTDEKALFEEISASANSAWLGGYSENEVWKWATGEEFISSILDIDEENGYLVYQNEEYFAATNDSSTYFICEWEYTNSITSDIAINKSNIRFNIFDYDTFEPINADVTYDELNKTLKLTADGYNTVNLTDISCVSGQTYSFAMVNTDSDTGIAAIRCNGYDALISNSVSGTTDKTLNIKIYPAIENVSKYQIIQDFAVVYENNTGEFSINTESLIKDKRIKIRIIDSNNQKHEKITTKIYVFSQTSDSFKITAGTEFKVTMPEVLGGFTFGIDMDVIPLTYYDDGSTIKIGIGAKEKTGESKDDKKEKCKNLKEAIDQYCQKVKTEGKKNYSEYQELKSLYKELDSKGIMSASYKAEGNFEIQVYGYLEIEYNEEGFQSEYGKAIMIMEGEIEKEWQILVGVIPIVAKAKLGAELNTEVEVGYDFVNSQWFCEGALELILPEVKVSAGVGVAYVADVSFYGSAKNVVKLNTKEDTVSASLDGEVGFSASLLFTNYSQKIWSGYMQYYYKDKTGEYYFDKIKPLKGLYAIENYSVDRSYLNSRSGWNIGDAKFLNTVNGNNTTNEIITSRTLQESINHSSTPKLIKLDDVTEMLVWTMDIEDRSDGNHTAIVYSIHNVILDTWTEPIIIDDDGTADFFPEVLYNNGDVYVIWSDANKQFDDGFDLKDVISSCEISYAVYGKYTKMFGDAVTITSDSVADVKPILAENNGKVMAFWLNNPNNDLLSQTGTNYIMQSNITDNSGVQKVITSDKPILSIAAVSQNEQLAIAYTLDSDGELMTTSDVEVFINKNGYSKQLTSNNEYEGQLSSETLNGKECLVFYSDSGLKASYDLSNVSTLLESAKYTEFDVVYQGDSGVIVYAASAGEKTQLYGYIVGDSSSEVLLGEIDGSVKDLNAVTSINGIVISYVSSTLNSETLETNFNLCTSLFDLFTDLSIDVNQADVKFDNTSFSVPVSVKNTGMQIIDGYSVNIYNEKDTLIHTQTFNNKILVGQTIEQSIELDKIEFPDKTTDYIAEVVATNATVVGNNNSAIFSIGFVDMAIDVTDLGSGENAVFLIQLKNNTSIPTSSLVSVKDENMNIVKTYSIPSFEKEYSFVIRIDELSDCHGYHFYIDGQREDFYLGNNSVYEYSASHAYDNACDKSCNICGKTHEITHEFGEYLYNNDATYEADGTKTHVCSVCGHTETIVAEGTKLEKPAHNGWVYEGGWVYYENGVKLTNRWLMDSVGWCYVGADGYCITNSWMADSIGWCYLDSNGRMATNQWIMDSQGWCYVGANGYCITNSWMADSIGWCYLDSNGRMATNQWIMDSQGWCYVGANGYCITNSWMADSIGWCYLDSNGRMVVNSWVQDSTGWCWLDESGYWNGIYY